ncbi:MAG: DUF4838 domain-containing protein, partial [Opitutus sp.]|nr:DUF4838 domain-containing protein [Opitutus sp.]
LGAGGILIRTLPNALVLLGTDDRSPADPDGTRYAVTTFLEDALGFRSLWPGELGFVAPLRKTVSVAALEKKFTPLIAQRKIRSASYNNRTQVGLDYLGVTKVEFDQQAAAAFGAGPQLPNWFKWQRMGGSIGLVSGHAFGYTWEKYHRDHPEWFALQSNGSRDLTNLAPDRARLCKSNLALVEALARDKIEELDRTGASGVSLSPNDGGRSTFCMCAECKRLDPPGGRTIKLWDLIPSPRREFDYLSLTDRMVWFWNQLATRIAAKHPHATLTVYAYSAYKAPPVREKLHPNIAVGFVGLNYRRESDRKVARDDWDSWSRATKRLYWRPNLLLFSRREGTPSLYAHKLGEDVSYFAHHSLLGTDFDSCMHHWSTEGVNYYVLARLLWNPDADVETILADYCEAGFGAAAPEVRRYLARIEAITSQIAENELPVTEPFTPTVVAELQAILSGADRMNMDDTVRRRIAFLRRGLEFSALQNRAHGWVARHAVTPLTPAEQAKLKAVQQEKWLFMRKLFHEEPLAVNVSQVAWGSEGVFTKFGWSGAKSVGKAITDADEEGRPVEPPPQPRGKKK